MTKIEFNDLVWNYGASGDKIFDGLNLTKNVKNNVIKAWGEIYPMLEKSDINNDDTSKEDTIINYIFYKYIVNK